MRGSEEEEEEEEERRRDPTGTRRPLGSPSPQSRTLPPIQCRPDSRGGCSRSSTESSDVSQRGKVRMPLFVTEIERREI